MIDGDDTFNIKTMLNDNWDKIDAAMGQVDIPDASLTVKGKVQLSSATDSAAENQAATPKAIKDAALQAKSYTDQQISLVTETGIPKLVSYPLLVTATADNQNVFEIPLDLFDANTDTLLVAINRAVLDATQYTLTNTVRDGAGQVTQRAKINLLSGVAATSEVTMVVLKNVPIGPDGAINGGVLATGSVPINRVDGLQDKLDQAFQAGNERKKEVVDALVALGVSASTNDSWDTLISKMATVIKATGNADVGDVLAGRTFSNASAAGLTGTMPNQGAKIITPGTVDQTIAAGYHNGAGLVKGDANLTSQNIKSGVTIYNVPGTLKPVGEAVLTFDGRSKPLPNGSNILDTVITLPAGVKRIMFTSDEGPSNNTTGTGVGISVRSDDSSLWASFRMMNGASYVNNQYFDIISYYQYYFVTSFLHLLDIDFDAGYATLSYISSKDNTTYKNKITIPSGYNKVAAQKIVLNGVNMNNVSGVTTSGSTYFRGKLTYF
ncbi:phage tail protein [Paenibacillus sp. 79R4]|uniref:phage tail protein n=1 Tax=Paenibacillus sp. 79R4 TaxID=2212847 RepID=UPI0015BA148A|nr:phage tail protein [Paenibacillus sp. 79R4]